jgi:hypothetical protein
MTKCIGSGVPGDVLEWGHEIIPGTEPHVFARVGNQSSYYAKRCRRCASTRYDWSKKVDYRAKASSTHREHAGTMAKFGFAENQAQASSLMVLAGVTREFIQSMFATAIGGLCPGLCGFPDRHPITINGDLHFDWRDPRFPLTPENCGPLCSTCNKQKGQMPWPEFMAQQRALRANLEQAVPLDPPLRLFDPRDFEP